MTVKLAISVPDELAEEARRAVAAGRAASVSAYVATAIEHYRRQQTLDEWLDDLDAELGPPDEATMAWAAAALGLDRPATTG